MNAYFSAAHTLLRSMFQPASDRPNRGGIHGRPPRPPLPSRLTAGSASPRVPRPGSVPAKPTARATPGTSLRPPVPTYPDWGAVNLLPDDEVLHFAVCGCTGSGKTLEIRQLMKSVLSGMSADEDRRALIYDAKRDAYPFLHALGLGPLVLNLNPFDRRGVAWDLAKDITSPAEIDQFASIVIPANPNEHNPFFTDSARILFSAAIVALQALKPGAWTLRDIILTVSSPERLQALLSTNPETKEIGENYFRAREISSVMTTIETKVRPLRVVAALWHRMEKKVSLRKDWLNRGSILLLAHHPSHFRSLEPINRAVFRYLSDAMLALPKSDHRRTWVFFDEVREAGKLDGLRPLLTQGRDRGVCVVLGFQDIEGLREVYGKEGANELLGECNSKTFLRTDNPATADWMVSHINKALIRARQVATDKDGKLSTTESLKIDSTILASDFLGIPVTGRQFGRKGFHISSRIPKPYWTELPLDTILAKLPTINARILGEDSRPASDQDLLPWNDADNARLNLRVASRPASEAPTDPAFQLESEVVTQPQVLPEVRREPPSSESPDQTTSASDLLWSTGRRRKKPNQE